MIERKQERRSLPTTGDRRSPREQPEQLDWSDAVAAVPGAIRPGVGEIVRQERRTAPESGME